MKNLILTSLLLLLSVLQTFSQDCKYDKNEIDKFNGKLILETKKTTVYANSLDPQMKSMFFRFSQIDSLNFLEVSKWYSSIISVNKSDKFLLKLDNGQLIELESMKYSIATPYSGKWHIDIDYFLSKENLKFLQNNLITEVRIYTTDGYIEESVNSKNSIKIKSSSNCIK